MTPGPVNVGLNGKFELTVLLSSVRFSGEYDTSGTWSLMVMLMVAEVEPPLLFAQMVYVIAVVCNTVGMPQIVPLLVPKLRPVGRLPLISHDVMTPEPVSVAFNGKSMLSNPLISVRFSGEYESIGTTSLMVMLMLVVELPLTFVAVMLY